MCEHSEVLALGCAVSRAYPIYNRKSGGEWVQKVTVGFILVGNSVRDLGDADIKCLGELCAGIRLAQEIVDAPTNEMHTDIFLDVSTMYTVVFESLASMNEYALYTLTSTWYLKVLLVLFCFICVFQ